MSISKTKYTSQNIDNLSFDETYEQAAIEILVENEAGTALVRQKPIATSDKQDTLNTLVQSSTDMECGGIVSVGTTAVEMTFTGTPKTITISAISSNTGTIYIGKSTVTNAGANAMAFLLPGESIELDYNDTSNALYAVASVAAQSVIKGALL